MSWRALGTIIGVASLGACTGGDDTVAALGDAAPGGGASDATTDGASQDSSRATADAASRGDEPVFDASPNEAASDATAVEGAPTETGPTLVDGRVDATDASGIFPGVGDAALEGAADGGPPAPIALAGVRVANWSPDAPAVDFCLAVHGTNLFQGPMLAARERDTTGDAGMLGFMGVSAYSLVAPGQYDARFVVWGSPDCSRIADGTMLSVLQAYDLETIALVGEVSKLGGDPGLKVNGFKDDLGMSGRVALRFIHAAPGLPMLDFGTGSGPNFAPWFAGVPFGEASSQSYAVTKPDAGGGVDANGYVLLPSALTGATLTARTHAASGADASPIDMAVAPSISAAAGTVLSVIAVGADAPGSPAHLLECVDNAGTVGVFSSCTLISP